MARWAALTVACLCAGTAEAGELTLDLGYDDVFGRNGGGAAALGPIRSQGLALSTWASAPPSRPTPMATSGAAPTLSPPCRCGATSP